MAGGVGSEKARRRCTGGGDDQSSTPGPSATGSRSAGGGAIQVAAQSDGDSRPISHTAGSLQSDAWPAASHTRTRQVHR